MAPYPPSDVAIQTVGLYEYCQVEGQRFKRKRGTEEWLPVQAHVDNTTDEPAPLTLSLVLEHQAPGEPYHWFLFVARENEPGMIYQVKGYAECMTYQPSTEPRQIWTPDTFLNMYELATLTEEAAAIVKEVAGQEPPPQAASRHDVKENGQGWTVRVLEKLAARGIVPKEKLEMVKSMVEPV
jgi:hypothetical protein